MTPGEYNFKTQKAGDTFNGLRLTCTTTSDENTTPIDLTGVVIKMDVRRSNDCDPILQLASNGTNPVIIIEDAAAGIFRIESFTIPNEESFKYSYDMEFTFSDGTVRTYIAGDFPIETDITK